MLAGESVESWLDLGVGLSGEPSTHATWLDVVVGLSGVGGGLWLDRGCALTGVGLSCGRSIWLQVVVGLPDATATIS